MGAPLLTPGQDEIAVQLAAGAPTVRGAAPAGDLIDTALDQRAAGQDHVENLPEALANFEQVLAQATQFLMPLSISLHVIYRYCMQLRKESTNKS